MLYKFKCKATGDLIMPGGVEEARLTDISDAYMHETLQMEVLILEKLHQYERASLDRIFEPFFTTKGPDKGTGDHPSPDYINVAASTTSGTYASGRVSVSAPTAKLETFFLQVVREAQAAVSSAGHEHAEAKRRVRLQVESSRALDLLMQFLDLHRLILGPLLRARLAPPPPHPPHQPQQRPDQPDGNRTQS